MPMMVRLAGTGRSRGGRGGASSVGNSSNSENTNPSKTAKAITRRATYFILIFVSLGFLWFFSVADPNRVCALLRRRFVMWRMRSWSAVGRRMMVMVWWRLIGRTRRISL
jgi:hypothetical protein